MTAAKHSDTSSSHQPLLPETQPTPQSQHQYVFVLPPYPPPNHHRLLRKSCRRCLISCATVLIFLAAALYILWPFDPELSVVRLHLDRLRFHMRRPKVSIDVTLNLTVRIRNQDFYSIQYDSSVVSIGYRGQKLGDVTSDGGNITARASSYVNATLQLERVEILSDVILLEDLAKGQIMFDIDTQIYGKLRVFFFDLPLKPKVSCEIVADTRNQTIYRQSCSPEAYEEK